MSPAPLGDRPESWPVRDSEDRHRDDWVIALRSDRVQRPGHEEAGSFDRIVMEHPGASVVLAIDDDDRVFCITQYRHAVQHRLVELPAGLCDVPGEDPLEVARRELREEGELAAQEWTHLLSTFPSPGVSTEQVHLYVARGLRHVGRGDFVPEHEEAELETDWVPFAQLRAAVLAGRVAHALVALAVLACEARGLVPSGESIE